VYISCHIVEKLIEISELCGEDIYYFGKVYSYTNSKVGSKKKIYSIEITNNVKGIKYEGELPYYFNNKKIKDMVFFKITRDEIKNSVYIFAPKDINMYNKYMTYIEAKNIQKEIEEYISM